MGRKPKEVEEVSLNEPLKAVSCMLTPFKPARPFRLQGVWRQPSLSPTGLVLFFEGIGARRVYESTHTKNTVVKLKGKWVRIDITSMTTIPPRKA